MRCVLFAVISLSAHPLSALDYEVQFENDQISIVKAKILPQEESWLHRDEYQHIVIAIQGGTITRLEANGTESQVDFPTGVAVFRQIDPPNELHKSVNRGNEPIELIIIQLKSDVQTP